MIVDDRIPGFLSGIEILERLHSDVLLRAATILIADQPAEWAERAAKIGVHCVLRRGGGLESLVTTAKSLIVLSPALRLAVVPGGACIENAAEQFDAMAPASNWPRRMFGYLKDESCSTSELAADISIDPKATCGLRRESTLQARPGPPQVQGDERRRCRQSARSAARRELCVEGHVDQFP